MHSRSQRSPVQTGRETQSEGAPPPDTSSAVLVHFYRAVVSHADVWRQRMDATTNWAAATTAGMVTFAFRDPAAPHVVLLLAIGFDAMFLLMESRRYQVYDLWRRRFRALNQYLIAPALAPGSGPDAQRIRENLALVAADLGRTVPHLPLSDAVGYRIRRNYGYLLGAVLLAWLAKLETHPTGGAGWSEILQRAAVGIVPGAGVVAAVAAFAMACIILAARAPSEHMRDWTTIPTPAEHLFAGARRWLPGGREA